MRVIYNIMSQNVDDLYIARGKTSFTFLDSVRLTFIFYLYFVVI